MHLQTLLQDAQRRLKEAGIDNPQLDTRLLFAHALRCDRAALVMQGERALSQEEVQTIETLIARRTAREPVARILGQREFWGLPFGLNEATLEPRPDSECLIETALRFLKTVTSAKAGVQSHESEATVLNPLDAGLRRHDAAIDEPLSVKKPLRLLDLGTGTGCLLLSLLHELPNATGVGVDLSPRATEQATLNARQLGLEARATFQEGHWLDGITETFDVILSNPPYIPSAVVETLAPEVKDFDPALALDGGADGLAPYRHLIPLLPRFLKPVGLALFEVGQGQARDVAALLTTNGFHDITITPDLGGVERCVGGTVGNHAHVFKTKLEIQLDDLRSYEKPSPGLRLEKALQKTYGLYRSLHDTVGKPYGWDQRARIKDKANIEALLSQSGVELWRFFDERTPIGYALITCDNNMTAELEDFGFFPEYCHKGYGAYFLSCILNRLRELNIKSVWLTTRSTNHPKVVSFYAKCGFSIVGTELL